MTLRRKQIGFALWFCLAMIIAIAPTSMAYSDAKDVEGFGEEEDKDQADKKDKKDKKGKKGKKERKPTFPEVYKTQTDAKEDVFDITDKVLLKNPSGIGINLKGMIFRPKDQSNFNIYNPVNAIEPIIQIKYFFIDNAKDCTETILRRKDAYGLSAGNKKKGTVKIPPGSVDNGIIRHYTIQDDKYVFVNKTKIKKYQLRSYYGDPIEEYVELENAGPKPKDGDIFQVETTITQLPQEKPQFIESRKKSIEKEKASGQSQYWLYALNAFKPLSRWTRNWEKAFSLDMSEKAPANNSTASMRMDISGKGPYTHFVSSKIPVLPIETMILDFWAKQKGMKDGTVKVEIGGFKGKEPVFAKELKVTDQWKKYSVDIEITKEIADKINSKTGGHGRFLKIGSDEKGTLWIDNFFFYRKKFKPFALIPEGRKLFETMRPGAIRHWASGTWGNYQDVPIRRALLKNSCNLPYNRTGMNLRMCLELCKVGNSNPWLLLDTLVSKEDINALMEYLCAPKDVGYGKVRAEQGHPEPWINEFRNIYLECDNEQWGFVNGNTEQYVPMVNYLFNEIRSNKYYKDGYFKLIANGWTLYPIGQKDPKRDENGKLKWHTATWGKEVMERTQSDVMDYSGYMRGFNGVQHLGDPGDETLLKATLMRAEFYHFNKYKQALDFRNELLEKDKNRRPFKFAVYEGGPGFSLYNPEYAGEGAQTLATGISCLNLFMKAQKKFDFLEFCIYRHSFGACWSTFNKNGEPLVITQMMKLRNHYCQGDMLDVVATQCKTVMLPEQKTLYKKKKNQAKPGLSRILETKDVPLSNCFAFKKENRYSFILYNLSLDEPRKIVLNLPYSPDAKAKMYFVTGDPRDRNNSSEVVKIQEKDISDFKNGYTFTMLPCSAYVIVNSQK